MPTETPDYKKIAELITPEKHICIKCKQHVASIGIICDSCIIHLNQLMAEFGLTTTKENKETNITSPSKYNS